MKNKRKITNKDDLKTWLSSIACEMVIFIIFYMLLRIGVH